MLPLKLLFFKLNRSLYLLFSLLIILPSNASRKVESINDSWFFTRTAIIPTDNGNTQVAVWEKINIPHTFNAQDGLVKKDYFRGTCWYKKVIDFSAADSSKSIYLLFEGVLSHAQVFLNGTFIGEHKGGYTAFGFDISEKIRHGKENVLLVKVNNENVDIAPLHGDFTIWGGVYRSVNLIRTEKTHFAAGKYGDNGLFIRTPQVSEKLATVSISATTINQGKVLQKALLKCLIRNKEEKIVASQILKTTLKPQETKTILLDKLQVIMPELWSPDAPYLYTVEMQLLDAKTNQVLDNLQNSIGFRWFHFDAAKGFFLNGKHLKLIGVNRHQDFDGLGSALSNDFHRRDVQLMKDMGVNFLRVAHYPQSKALLDACDRLGIICWEEIPMVDYISLNDAFYTNCENNLNEMIAQHYNHTSIICWGFMNEIFLRLSKVAKPDKYDDYYKRTLQYAQKLDSVAHSADRTRLTTIAFHIDDAYAKSGLASVTDLIGWNVYKGWYGDKFEDFCTFMDAQHTAHPERPLIVSEFGAGSDRRIHSQNGQMFDFSMEYQQQFHEAYLPYILKRDYIVGATAWNMFDFGSADRDESMPRINNKGLCYYNRVPKDLYFYYQAKLRKEPVLHIATRDWLVRTALSDSISSSQSSQSVKVYSNLKKVELFANSKSLGIKEIQNCHAIWIVPFDEGNTTLVAKGVEASEITEDATSVEFKLLPPNLSGYNGKSLELGINCGSNCDFTDDKSGMTWLADRPFSKGSFGYVGGSIYKSKPWVIGFIDQIQGTRNGPLFQTIRLGAMGYQFDVPNGEYEVELSFTSPNTKTQKILPPENVFDVLINGEVVLPAWNIAANGGELHAITKKFRTQSAEMGIKIEFRTLKGTTLISGIKIFKTN